MATHRGRYRAPDRRCEVSFTAIRNAFGVIASVDMSPSAKLVLLALSNRHNQETGRCDPSVATIAADTQMSARAVQYGLRELEQIKAITTIERKQRSGRGKKNLTNRYRIAGGAKFACGGVQDLRTKQEYTPSAFDDLAMSIEIMDFDHA
jgi:hypothetical protein